jgi:hypothetical protein
MKYNLYEPEHYKLNQALCAFLQTSEAYRTAPQGCPKHDLYLWKDGVLHESL